jgi:hypothetical protein
VQPLVSLSEAMSICHRRFHSSAVSASLRQPRDSSFGNNPVYGRMTYIRKALKDIVERR